MKIFEKMVANWDDVNKILEYWTKLLVYRMFDARGGTNCLPATE